MQESAVNIYWANAMFSEADRDFNNKYVNRLKELGYSVFLPQKSKDNESVSPSAGEIFLTDTSAIISAKILIACIDQESIDCGVAAEIGIAYAYGIPVIGLYTDIRRYRTGEGRMYKNLYILGMIKTYGEVVSNFDELATAVKKIIKNGDDHPKWDFFSIRHSTFDKLASNFMEYISKLESWYEPPWSVSTNIVPVLSNENIQRILDFGCGASRIGTLIRRQIPHSSYIGYDESNQMIGVAKSLNDWDECCAFSSSWSFIKKYSPFNAALFSFVLHDEENYIKIIKDVVDLLDSNGFIIITDLTIWDLPRLTNILRCALASPCRARDERICPSMINNIADSCNLIIDDCRLHMPKIHFPNSEAIDEYLSNFGIYEGMDLPLGLSHGFYNDLPVNKIAKEALEECIYPFTDQRVFITCILKQR